MKRVNKVLLSTGLAMLPLSTAWAAGWAAPSNYPAGAPKDFDLVVNNTTNWILGFVGLVAILALIFGGVQYLTAAGNEDQVRDAKATIKNAIIGLVIAGLAYAIVLTIVTKVLVESSSSSPAT
ncbi:MAG: pilin [Patescibacteria group bacterium]